MNASATVLPEKATHQQTRTFNQQLVLRALHDASPLSRADLARLTGLTRTSGLVLAQAPLLTRLTQGPLDPETGAIGDALRSGR